MNVMGPHTLSKSQEELKPLRVMFAIGSKSVPLTAGAGTKTRLRLSK